MLYRCTNGPLRVNVVSSPTPRVTGPLTISSDRFDTFLEAINYRARAERWHPVSRLGKERCSEVEADRAFQQNIHQIARPSFSNYSVIIAISPLHRLLTPPAYKVHHGRSTSSGVHDGRGLYDSCWMIVPDFDFCDARNSTADHSSSSGNKPRRNEAMVLQLSKCV